MTIEVATYITDLQPVNPASTDQVAQGDDHLRLIKQVLQNTFPNANKVNYFPAIIGNISGVLPATYQNAVVYYDTSSGGFAVTLPTLTSAQGGWSCTLVKISGDQNAITVSPASGNIYSPFGLVPTIRVGATCSPAQFVWSGATWICMKSGPLIGSTANFDGPTIPAGYLNLDGSSFSSTTFAELASALGTNVLRDKRGRADFGVDTGQVNMNTTGWGGATSLGSARGGGGYASLGMANMASYTPSGSVSTSIIQGGSYPNMMGFISPGNNVGYGGTNNGGLGVSLNGLLSASSSFSGNNNGGSSAPFSIVPPGIATQKIIRAC